MSSQTTVAHVPSSIFSHHTLLLHCHSPFMVKERLSCCDSSIRELHWHCHSERGELLDLALTNTHPSFLGIEGPLPCGSFMQLVQAPNDLVKARPLHLTIFSRRLQERGYRRCVRTPQRRRTHASCPVIAAAAPNCFFGQPYLYMSPKSGEKSLPDRRASSSAIMCRPMPAHAFTFFG